MEDLSVILALFDVFITCEKELENARILLASNLLFEPFTSFKEIDKSLSGFIAPSDLQFFLSSLGLCRSITHFNKLVNSYSTHEPNKLFVGDFLKFILPTSKISLREDALRRKGGFFDRDAIQQFLNVFLIELEMWERAEGVKKSIGKNTKSELKRVFEAIDVPRGGYLTVNKIKSFLEGFGQKYDDEEAQVVVNRIDLDHDGIVSFEEFFQSIMTESCFGGDEMNGKSLQERYGKEESNKEGREPCEDTGELDKMHNKGQSDGGNKALVKDPRKKIKESTHSRKKSEKSVKADESPDCPEEITVKDQSFKVPKVKVKKQPNKNTNFDTPSDLTPFGALQFFLQKILTFEETLDKEKKKLLVCPDFSLVQIFKIFDPNSLNFSTESDFLSGLSAVGVKVSKEEASLFFKHYSKKYNKRLCFDEFCEAFLPYLERFSQTDKQNDTQELHQNTLKKVKSLLQTCFKQELELERLRQVLKRNCLRVEDVFRGFGNESVGKNEIVRVMIEKKRELKEKELVWILKYFKKQLEESFGIEEFEKNFRPRCSKKLI